MKLITYLDCEFIIHGLGLIGHARAQYKFPTNRKLSRIFVLFHFTTFHLFQLDLLSEMVFHLFHEEHFVDALEDDEKEDQQRSYDYGKAKGVQRSEP